MDLAAMTGQDREVLEVGGRTFRAGPLTLDQWGELQAWIRRTVKTPLARAVEQLNELDAAGVRLRPADRQAILDGGRRDGREWPPPVGTAAWFECLRGPDGDRAFLSATLGPFNPDLAAAELPALADAATAPQLRVLLRVALGLTPEPAPDGGEADPKAGAGADPRPTPRRPSGPSPPPGIGAGSSPSSRTPTAAGPRRKSAG